MTVNLTVYNKIFFRLYISVTVYHSLIEWYNMKKSLKDDQNGERIAKISQINGTSVSQSVDDVATSFFDTHSYISMTKLRLKDVQFLKLNPS